MPSSTPTPSDSFLEPKRQTRRAWWFAGGAFVTVLGIVVSVLLLFDVPPVDDSSLTPPPERPTTLPNPLAEFLATPPTTLQVDLQNLPEEVREAFPGHEPVVRDFLAQHTSTLGSLERLLSTDPSTWRWPGLRDPAKIEAAWDNVFVFPLLGRLLELRAKLKHQTRDAKGAMEDCLRMHQLVSGLAQADGEAEFQLIYGRILTSANPTLERLVVTHEYGPEQLAEIQSKLSEYETRPADLIIGLKLEHQRIMQALQSPTVREAEWNHQFSDRPLEKALAAHLYKPNMTLATRQAFLLPVVQGLEVGWSQAYRAVEDAEAEMARIRRNPFRKHFNPNAGGYVLATESLGRAFWSVHSATCNAAFHRSVMLQIALRRYHLDTGSLPKKLSQLVPMHLPELPLDPLDGLPLRWNARNQAIYSVGQNLVDDGGIVDRPGHFGSADLGIHYWWSEEARKHREDR